MMSRLRERFRLWRADAAAARRNRAAADTCFYCGTRFGGDGARARTVDHRVPKSRGGTDGLVNLVFACRSCNHRKGDTPEAEFLASPWLARRRAEVHSEER